MHPPRLDRRHDANIHQWVALIALVVTLVVNVATLAWGWASLASAVSQLKEIVSPLVIQQQIDHTDLSVLKDRLNRGNDAARQ